MNGLRKMNPRSFLFVTLFMGMLFAAFLAWWANDFAETGFPLYGPINRSYSYLRRILFRERVFDKTLIGKERWLIYTDEGSIDDYQHINAFSEADLMRLQEDLDTLNETLRQKGIKFLVVIPPNKNTIYPEYVPEEIPVANAPSRYDQLTKYMRQHGKTQILDLRPALLEARKTRVVYFSKDTHWNDYGAVVAYQQIILALQADFSVLQPHPLSDFQQTTRAGVALDLAENVAAPDLATDDIVLSPLYASNTTYYQEKHGGRRLTIGTNPNTALPKIVIYHDSFFNRLIPLVGDHFQKSVFIPLNSPPEIWNFSWIDSENPDIVILEFTERYIDQIPKYVNLPKEAPP
jgi:alginate O-acetyltransferase complex protein AlgJ